MSTILTGVTVKVLSAAFVVASATYVVNEAIWEAVPVTPAEIAAGPDTSSSVASSGADAAGACIDPATGGNSEGGDDLCVTVEDLTPEAVRTLTTSGDAVSNALNSGEAIAEAIRSTQVAAAPLSAGPNGSTTQS